MNTLPAAQASDALKVQGAKRALSATGHWSNPHDARHTASAAARPGSSAWPVLALLATLSLAAPVSTLAQTVFDPAAGSPAVQGWISLPFGAAGSGSTVAGTYQIDTRGGTAQTFGQALFSPVALDAIAGWQAELGLQVLEESHNHADRAGFSLLFVGNNPAQSIEIAFWADRVFAYAYQGGGFVQGVGAAFDTRSTAHQYQLSVSAQGFNLSADGTLLFSGALQDYTPQGLPYTVPNFIYFGDNTSSAGALVQVGSLSLTTPVPEPAGWALMALGLAGLLAWQRGQGGAGDRGRKGNGVHGPSRPIAPGEGRSV